MAQQKLIAPPWIASLWDEQTNRDLVQGVGAPMRILSIRGKVWHVQEPGEDEQVLTDANGQPVYSLPCCILRANPVFTRKFYANPFKDGTSAPPTCWSLDGKTPDVSVADKQNPVCPSCPQNAWGSRKSEMGSRGKACAEHRRLAVLPQWLYADPDNLEFDNLIPYLLSVPPGSLQALKKYGDILQQAHLTYPAMTTLIGFNPESLFELSFKPQAFIPQKLAGMIHDLQVREETSQVLAISESTTRLEAGQGQRPSEPEPEEEEQATEEVEEKVQVPTPAPAQPEPAKPAAAAKAPTPPAPPLVPATTATAKTTTRKPVAAPAGTPVMPATTAKAKANVSSVSPGLADLMASLQPPEGEGVTLNGEAEEGDGEPDLPPGGELDDGPEEAVGGIDLGAIVKDVLGGSGGKATRK